jgi:hypothetical protein
MNVEESCAQHLRIREAEEFLAVGERVAHVLNVNYERDREAGRTRSLPDLLSTVGGFFRLREVKFKLDEKNVRKAVAQLRSGARYFGRRRPESSLDRLEIVVPLGARRLKAPETEFLGPVLAGDRFRLVLDGRLVNVTFKGKRVPVTVLVL